MNENRLEFSHLFILTTGKAFKKIKLKKKITKIMCGYQ